MQAKWSARAGTIHPGLLLADDGLLRDDEFHAAVGLATGGCLVRRDGGGFAEALTGKSYGVDPGVQQVAHGRRRSSLGQVEIVRVAASRIRMAVHPHMLNVGRVAHHRCDLVQQRVGSRLDGVRIGFEE